MDDQSKRMLLLGRQAPPKKLDLRLEPRTHVSPHHAPVADMIYRVEKHLSVSSPGDGMNDKGPEFPHKRMEKAQTEEAKLSSYQKKVKLRAAQVQKELRHNSMQWQREKQMKQETLIKMKEYSQKVAASNILKSGRVNGAASNDCSSDDESECSRMSDLRPDTVPNLSEYRCRSSQSASPSRNYIEPMTDIGGTGRGADKTLEVSNLQIDHCADILPKRWANRELAGKRIALPGAPMNSMRTATSNLVVPGVVESDCVDVPIPPPPHVTAQVHAWQQQDQLYRGAACPCVASDDPELFLSGLNSTNDQASKPAHVAVTQFPDDQVSRLQATDFHSHRDSARRSLLRHCSPGRHTCLPYEPEQHRASPELPRDAIANVSKPLWSVNLDRVAGGGPGLPETAPCPNAGDEAVQHVTNASVLDFCPQMKTAHGVVVPGEPTPIVRSFRCTVSAATDIRESRRSGKRIMGAGMLARLENKVVANSPVCL